MKLKTLFPLIVGQLLTSAVGLTSCTVMSSDRGPDERYRGPSCSTERFGESALISDEDDAFNAAFDSALSEFERDNPGASPAEALEALYGNDAQAIRAQDDTLAVVALNTRARELLLATVEAPEGRVSSEMCMLLCSSVLGNSFDECVVSDYEDPEYRNTLECVGSMEVCHPAGRRFEGMSEEARVGGEPLGRAWAHIAFAEMAAVHAFSLLAAELAHHGAPRELVEGCVAALADEVEHARLTVEMARRHGAEAISPVSAPAIRPPRPLLEIALENAEEGCVREAYAALETTWQAQRADDQDSRDVFARIAADETGHAELSWALHGWLMGRLSEDERAQVRVAMDASVETLAGELGQRPAEMMNPALGLPDAETARSLLGEFERHIAAA